MDKIFKVFYLYRLWSIYYDFNPQILNNTFIRNLFNKILYPISYNDCKQNI